MKNHFNRLTLLAVLVALVMSPLSRAQAQGNMAFSPAVVVSLTNIEEHLSDVNYLLTAAGQADAAPLVKFFVVPYLEGIDKTKPIGGAVVFQDGQPKFVAFIPVTDLNAVMEKVEAQAGPAEDAGDGVQKLTSPDGQDLFVKEKNGWALAGNDKALFDVAPEDPSSLLSGLNKTYNVAVRLNIQNVPKDMKEMLIGQYKQLMGAFQEGGLDADPESAEALEKVTENAIQSVKDFAEQGDQITVGWGVDAMAKSTFIDFSMTALDGTKLSKRMAMLHDAKTNFSGFVLDGAAATFNFANKLHPDDIATYKLALQTTRKGVMPELDNDDDLNAQQKVAAKELVGTVIDVLTQTVESGKLDGGGALLLEPGSINFVAGGYIADGTSMDKSFRELINLAKDGEDFPFTEVQFDAEKHGEIAFHKLRAPVDDEEARPVLGDEVEIAVGFGMKSFYIAFGKNPVATLKQVIDKSAGSPDKSVRPVQITVALLPILKFAASVSEDPIVGMMVEALESTPDNDKIRISSHAIQLGGTTRVELDEGVLQLIGVGVKARMQGGGGGDF